MATAIYDGSAETVKTQLINLYEQYAPNKVKNVQKMLQKYAGHEHEMLQAARAKYGLLPIEFGDSVPVAAPAPAPAEDENPYGYGETPDDTAKYGYGDTSNNGDGGDGTYQTGYNDEEGGGGGSRRLMRNRTHGADDIQSVGSQHSIATVESYGEYGSDEAHQPERRQRYRRRGSVTKYSIGAQDEVKAEYDQQEQILDQYRNATGGEMAPGDSIIQPLNDLKCDGEDSAKDNEAISDDGMSDDGAVSHDASGEVKKRRSKGKKLLKNLKGLTSKRRSMF